MIRYPRGCGAVADWRQPFAEIPFGKGRKLKDGKDIAVLSIGNIGNNVAKAVEGTDAAHYDMRFLKPLDYNIIKDCAREYNRIVTVEDGSRMGGFGSAVLEALADICGEEGIPMPQVQRIGIPDSFIEHGTVPQLQEICGLDAEGIKRKGLQP